MDGLTWREPQRQHDEAWCALLAAIEAVDQRGEVYELDDLDDEWASIWSHPETDARFVWDGREMVAFAWIKALPGRLESHRIACWGGVRPSHRRRGIGTAVLAWQVARSREMALAFDASLPTRVEVDALDTQPELFRMAARLGFGPGRRFLDVARPTDLPLPEVTSPDGLELLQWSEELDEVIRLAHAASFTEHWGSEPRGPEEWRQWYTGHRGFRADLSQVAVEVGTGAVVGFLLPAAYPQDWGVTPREAWINNVGTVPARRRRGVARWVVCAALAAIRDAPDGFERAILGVDSANSTGALELYRGLGFEDVKASTVLVLDPAAR